MKVTTNKAPLNFFRLNKIRYLSFLRCRMAEPARRKCLNKGDIGSGHLPMTSSSLRAISLCEQEELITEH